MLFYQFSDATTAILLVVLVGCLGVLGAWVIVGVVT